MCPVRFLDRDPMLDVPGTADVPLTALDRARGLKGRSEFIHREWVGPTLR